MPDAIQAAIPFHEVHRQEIKPVTAFSSKSLLRYPGGKTRGTTLITSYFPKDITAMCSPFFGGGSIELYMAAKGVFVYGYDVFKPLAEFWQCVAKNREQLAEKVAEYYPLSKEAFYHLQEAQTKFKTKLERAAVYYVLNRSSFSGATLSGGMSPGHPRFTLSSIQRLGAFYNPNVDVKCLDFQSATALHTNQFLYLDPPYLISSTLYGKKGDAHKGFDHETLCEILKKRDYWILSYNDCAAIKMMYKDYQIISPLWKYGMSADKASKEVLIFSKDIHLHTEERSIETL